MKTHCRIHRSHAAAAAAAVLFATLAGVTLAGGIERNTITSLDQPEIWSPVPANGVPFAVVRYQDANGQFYAPGFPYIESLSPPADPIKVPGIIHVIEAAEEWDLHDASAYPHANATAFRFDTATVGPVFSAASSLSPLSAPPPAGIGSPTGVPLPPIPPRVFYADGTNMVNLFEPSSTFGPLGGALPLALTAVYIDAVATGTILEADIAFNTRATTPTGAPLYSFIAAYPETGQTFATNAVSGTDHAPPALCYASLKGVMMHELGHATGLGHSIVDVDSSTAQHEYATMNFVGTVDGAFSTTIAVPKVTAGPIYGYSDVGITTAGTQFGGYMAREAETLSLDDRCALIEGYPGPALQTALGGIAGQVFQDPNLAGPNAPLRLAHVVAFDPDDSNRRRAGRISFQQGNYQIDGLEPGNYALLVEPVDIGGYLFPNAPLPSIVSPPATPFQNFFTELYGGPAGGSNNGEAHTESGLHQVFATIQVTAGQVTTGVDLRVQARPANTPDPLTVVTSSQIGPGGTVPPTPPFVLGPSAHGIQVPVGVSNAFPTDCFFTIDAGSANAGQGAYFLGSLVSGRLDVGPNSSAAGSGYRQLYVLDTVAPAITFAVLDGAGRATLPFRIPGTLGLTSIQGQAMFNDLALGHFVLTNRVSVRTAFP